MIEPVHAKYILEKFKAYYDLPNWLLSIRTVTAAQIVTTIEQLLKAKKE